MNGPPAGGAIRAVLLDIEGTTTPIAFVTEVLFPYARRHVRLYLEQHLGSPAHESLWAGLRAEHEADRRLDARVPEWAEAPRSSRVEALEAYVAWLMDRDRKSTGLKELQGRIWEEGYARGDLVGEVFPDVPVALSRWHADHVPVCIFSSGSTRAQRLLFRHSSAGDLDAVPDRVLRYDHGAESRALQLHAHRRAPEDRIGGRRVRVGFATRARRGPDLRHADAPGGEAR